MTHETRAIYCAACNGEVPARLTNGGEIYPHRPDLQAKRLWRCDKCGNYVGCHAKSKEYAPLGVIPTPELRIARRRVHVILDPICNRWGISRSDLYAAISNRVGHEYHTALIRSVKEAEEVYLVVQEIARNGILDGSVPE